MTQKNTPSEGQEENNSAKREKNGNLPGLLKEAIFREFGNPIDPIRFDNYKKSKNQDLINIHSHMWDIYKESPEDWGNIDQNMIQSSITHDNLSERIIRLGQTLTFRRKRIIDRAIQIFPDIKNERSDWHTYLSTELSEYDELKLQDMLLRTAILRNFLKKLFPGLTSAIDSEKRDLSRIFHDIDTVGTSEDKTKIFHIHRDYFNHGILPTSENIVYILGLYRNQSDQRKKEILSALGLVLTYDDAYRFGLVPQDFLPKFAKAEFGALYDSLSSEDQKSFCRSLSQNNDFQLSPEDFDIQKLGTIFTQNKKIEKIATEIFKDISRDVVETDAQKKGDTIIHRVKYRKQEEQKKVRASGVETDMDYDLYDEVIDQIRIEKNQNIQVGNIDILKSVQPIIQYTHDDGTTQYLQVARVRDAHGNPLESNDGLDFGVEVQGFHVANGHLTSKNKFFLTFDQLQKFLTSISGVNILSAEDFDKKLVKTPDDVQSEEQLVDARNLDIDPIDHKNILTRINLIDPDGTKFGFEKGTAFIAPVSYDNGKTVDHKGVWTIHKIHGNFADIADPSGNVSETNIPLEQLYTLIQSTSGFKRVAKVHDDNALLEQLQGFDLDSHVKLKDGKLVSEDEHHHKKVLKCFASEKGGHIRLESMKDGRVRFGEYATDDELGKVKDHAAKHGEDKIIKSKYKPKTLSYPAFLEYLRDQKLKVSEKDLIVPDAEHDLHDDHGHHHPHVHGSLLSRIMQMQNPASIWKGFEMIFHGIEHTLEKGAKLDAAKFALRTSKLLGLPDSVSAQIYADVVDGSKEIVEKYEKKIFGLPGPRGREKCLHIVENLDSRPEEVAAAMSYMLKSYGHLYAEDIKHKQTHVQNKEHCVSAPMGTFLFFDAFVKSSGLPGSIHVWRKKAYEKAIAEMGSEHDHEGEPTEEQMLHAIFKTIDGDWALYPYAASVVKAIGGPGGFEKMWKFEGFDNAKKKGEEQTQMVSAQGRLNKAIGYLGTHELYKGIGAMEAVTGKVKVPKFQAFPVVWCAGGFSRYASHTALQKIKGYAEKGYTFHAYAFMRTYENNQIYRKTVRLALEDKQPGLGKEFDDICHRLEYNPDNEKATKNAAIDMMNLWQKHCDGPDGIHERLQGHNGWLIKKVHDGDMVAKNYLNILSGKHEMQLNSDSISGELMEDWYNEWGFRMNRIVSYDKKSGLLSLQRNLMKIQLKSTRSADKEMSNDHYDKIWGGVIEQMEAIRDPKFFGGDIELQKKQYEQYRREIIEFFVKQLQVRSGEKLLPKDQVDRIINLPHKYWNDLRNMGIDPRSIFDPDLQEANVSSEYTRWKDNSPFGNTQSHHTVDVEEYVRKKATRAIDVPPPKKKSTGRVDSPPDTGHDEDTMYSGGSADPTIGGDDD